MVVANKYRLKHPLSSGGMASLWVARNLALDIDVALKWVLPELANEVESRLAERMLNEARAAAQLGHSAIVRILDFAQTEQGEPFIVMELLDGEDLATAMARRGRLSAVKTLKIMLPIAGALDCAHERGIVHRDVKPENIFLVRNNDGVMQPKLIDFGVAKFDDELEARLTSVGAIIGSPHYLSPEQARGHEIDLRADVWSFCVVLYEVIVGRRPFEGKTTRSLLRAIVEDEIVPTTYFGAGDDALWVILQRGLVKDPAQRYASMRLLGAALARWLVAHDVHQDVCGASLQLSWLSSASERAGFSDHPPSDRSPLSFEERDTLLPGSSESPSHRRPSMPSVDDWSDNFPPPARLPSDATPALAPRVAGHNWSLTPLPSPRSRSSTPLLGGRALDVTPRCSVAEVPAVARSVAEVPAVARSAAEVPAVARSVAEVPAAEPRPTKPNSLAVDVPAAAEARSQIDDELAMGVPTTAPPSEPEPAVHDDEAIVLERPLALQLWQLVLVGVVLVIMSSAATWWMLRAT